MFSWITKMEELVMNAWPAMHTHLYDGWVIRFADQVTHRAYAVNPLYFSNFLTREKIEYCQYLYNSRNLDTFFKITQNVFPSNLDSILDTCGYNVEPTVAFQTMDLIDFKFEPTFPKESIQRTEESDPKWVENWLRLSAEDPSHKKTYCDILAHILTKKCLFTYTVDKKPAAMGFGVLENEYLGLFGLIVASPFRGLGYGRYISEQILNWGRKRGASKAYLQVYEHNEAAVNLYRKIGFTTLYSFHYRVKPRV